LIDRRGVNWRLRAPRRIQTPGAKSRVTLIDVVHKHTVDRAEDAVPCMTRKLQFSPIANQVYDSIGHLALFISRPLALEIEHVSVEM
jgi:hypothetical protein